MERTITTSVGLDKVIATALQSRNAQMGTNQTEGELIISLLAQSTFPYRSLVFKNILTSWPNLSSDDRTFVLGKLGLGYVSGAEVAQQVEVLSVLAMSKYLALSTSDQNAVMAKF